MTIQQEGENINPDSIIRLETQDGKISFPSFSPNPDDPFMQKINRSGEKWIILTDKKDEPKLLLDADGFIRSALFCSTCDKIEDYCHNPIILKDK
jgi:hypothetical protein